MKLFVSKLLRSCKELLQRVVAKFVLMFVAKFVANPIDRRQNTDRSNHIHAFTLKTRASDTWRRKLSVCLQDWHKFMSFCCQDPLGENSFTVHTTVFVPLFLSLYFSFPSFLSLFPSLSVYMGRRAGCIELHFSDSEI